MMGAAVIVGAEQAGNLIPVRILHDPVNAAFAYFDVPKVMEPADFHLRMCEVLRDALRRSGFDADVVDAKRWLEICKTRSRCVVVNICQYPFAPLYGGEDEGSAIEQWLDAGGMLVYSGDWPFFWYLRPGEGLRGAGAGGEGDDDIFDANLVEDGFVGIKVEPTDLGRKWLPSLRGGTTQRPFDAEAVKRHCPWHEFYSLGKRRKPDGKWLTAADALCFRMPAGKGYFAAFHLRRGTHTDSNQVIYEFITRRLPRLLGKGG